MRRARSAEYLGIHPAQCFARRMGNRAAHKPHAALLKRVAVLAAMVAIAEGEQRGVGAYRAQVV
jgi:hypothetical protein